MKTIIAGGREFKDKELLDNVMSVVQKPSLIISGDARGADTMGAEWANRNNIPVAHYPAQWTKHGRSAGFKRNVVMAEQAEQLIAFWDYQSRGTGHMIEIAKEKGLKTLIIPDFQHYQGDIKAYYQELETTREELLADGDMCPEWLDENTLTGCLMAYMEVHLI